MEKTSLKSYIGRYFSDKFIRKHRLLFTKKDMKMLMLQQKFHKILSKIAKSNYRNNITVKGGVVMFNITKDKRRATVDIDIDLIRYSLEDKSILLLFDKLNQIDDGIKIVVNKKIKPLKHQDYQGKRVNIILKDSFRNQIETKIDIGVHKNLDIKQEEYMFNFEVFNNSMTLLINTKEQIFVEKLSSMLKHGIRTTRYKDIYDFYYLITEGNMDKSLLIKLINIYCINNISRVNNTSDIVNELSRIFNNPNFLYYVQNSRYNWIGENTNIVLNTIFDFIKQLEPLVV